MTNPVTHDGKVKISVNFDKDLLEEIDRERKIKGFTRSGWFQVAAMHFLQKGKNEDKKNITNEK